MKQIITILALMISVCQISFCQKDTVVVFGLRHDSSPFDWRIKHFWNNLKNPVNVTGDLIKIWCDNGTVDTCSTDLFDYYVKPSRVGNVNVYCKLKTKMNGKSDTIFTVTRFTSIPQPKIIAMIDGKYLKDSLKIRYSFTYAINKKALDETRYQLGAFPNPFKVLNDNKEQIGEIFDFSEPLEIEELLKTGKILKVPSFAIRDMETDLIIWTPEFEYKLK